MLQTVHGGQRKTENRKRLANSLILRVHDDVTHHM